MCMRAHVRTCASILHVYACALIAGLRVFLNHGFTRTCVYVSLVQVQRKQLQKTVQGTESKSTKPSASPSPPKDATKQENKGKEEQAVEEKLEKLSLDDTQETEPNTQPLEPSSKSTAVIENLTVMRDQERIQSDSAQDASSSEDMEQSSMTTVEEVEQEAGGGGEGEEKEEEGESEDQEELKAKVEEAEEQLLKRLERMQAESQVTQETIKKMTGYLKALDVAPDVISPSDEGTTPQSESRSADNEDGASGGNASVMVGHMDPIAQAALLASIKDRTTTATSVSATPEEEAGEIMEPVQVSETDPNNVVIAGEIVGGAQIAPRKSTEEEDAHPAASEPPAVDPKIESGEAGGPIGQTAQNLEPVLREIVDDTPAAPTTIAKETIVEAPTPSFHSPSKKPKRQLAASFTNITKE